MSETPQVLPLFSDPSRSTRPELQTPAPLPMTSEEISERGWAEVDVVFITGDAYVDSPSFANGLLARVLEKDGFKVAVLSQPNWNSVEDFRKFGRPRLAFCISAGNMDSMINHYTANRKVRNDDAYSPGGKIGRRPDRATLAYCQRAREAFPGVPIIAGGIEASLRRIAHYDYWSDKVRRSIALDAKVDLLIYGMGERPLLTIMRRLDAGESVRDIRNVRGTVYKLGKNEDLPEESDILAHLPSYDDVAENEKNAKLRFVRMTQIAYENLNPYRAKTLVQEHGDEAIVVNPPDFPLSEEDMNAVYSLPFTRKAHPSYTETIPAVEVVHSSVQTHRGCFGGCSFCAITAHQGKFIQPRSEDAIIEEVQKLANEAGGNYVVSDLNAPTANMYRMHGKNQEACKHCARISCLCPEICLNLNVDHTAYIELLKRVRNVDGVKSVLIASGIRTDLAIFSPEFIEELAAHHTGGHLKTAPEHVDDEVLKLMNKPSIENYEQFCEQFIRTSCALGKEQYLVPYLIAGFPGCTLQSMVGVAEYLKKNDIRPEQVQDFIPAPFQIATCAYYTGVDPITEDQVYVPRGLRERRLQHALLLYYNSAFYHDVKTALKEAHREDLIGTSETSLISPYPSKAQSMRQTSRLKRLLRKEESDARAKEERRKQFEEQEENARNSYGKRIGRDRSSSNGGYRSGAREFGTAAASSNVGSRYSTSKEWDPIDKVWRKSERIESPVPVRADDRPRKEGGFKRFDERSERPQRKNADGFVREEKRTFRKFDGDNAVRNEKRSFKDYDRKDHGDVSSRESNNGEFQRGRKFDRDGFSQVSRLNRSSKYNGDDRRSRFQGESKYDRSGSRFSEDGVRKPRREFDDTNRRNDNTGERREYSKDFKRSSGNNGNKFSGSGKFGNKKGGFSKGGRGDGFKGSSKFSDRKGSGFRRSDG